MMEEAVPLTPDCIRIDEAYFAQGQGTQAQGYLEQCHAQAMQLRRSLERRNKTLLMCFETLISAQQRFFFEGTPGHKSYTRRRIAQALKVHESTVTRAEEYLLRLRLWHFSYRSDVSALGVGRNGIAAAGRCAQGNQAAGG